MNANWKCELEGTLLTLLLAVGLEIGERFGHVRVLALGLVDFASIVDARWIVVVVVVAAAVVDEVVVVVG